MVTYTSVNTLDFFCNLAKSLDDRVGIDIT